MPRIYEVRYLDTRRGPRGESRALFKSEKAALDFSSRYLARGIITQFAALDVGSEELEQLRQEGYFEYGRQADGHT